jgi:hypothetical protein
MKSLSRGPSPIVTVKIPRELLEELRQDCDRSDRTWSEYLRTVLRVGARSVREAGAL